MKTLIANLETFLIDNIDFECYGIKTNNPFKTGIEVFKSEYDHEIKRYGVVKAFKNYLGGLPSWINIPFYYWDIKNLMYSFGEINSLEMDDDEVSNLYYQRIAEIFLKNCNL